MDLETDPNAQGQHTPAETAGTDDLGADAAAPSENQQSGVQKRINELTRARHEAERKAEEAERKAEERYNQLLAVMTQQPSRAAPAEPPVPQVEFDPEERKKFDAYYASVVAPKFKQLEEENNFLKNRVAVSGFGQAAVGEDPRVVALAERFMQGAYGELVRTGKAIPEDVLDYARGKIAKEDRLKGARGRTERSQYNSGSDTTLSGHSNPAPRSPASDELPKDFDNWSSDRQAAYWEKRLDGVKF